MNKKSLVATFTVFVVILIDQISKIWVKTNMRLDDSFNVIGTWFRIHFTENPGMAMGISWGGVAGKYFLSGFRIVAIGFLIYYIYTLIKKNASTGLIFSISLILAGATGNILDSLFYGLYFSESTIFEIAKAFPIEGYTTFMQGKVVDMLYFPLFYMPEYVPVLGGHKFFPYIFNIADAAVSIGAFTIILFQKKFFEEK